MVRFFYVLVSGLNIKAEYNGKKRGRADTGTRKA